jgi:DNA-nicking Smr family endonuclease
MTHNFPSDEDKALFRAHMQAVKPLNKESTIQNTRDTTVLPSAPVPPPPRAEAKEAKKMYLSDFISETVFANSNLSYCKAQVPSRRFRALKNGQISWGAKLDLHGFQSDTAREALSHFIQVQIQNNTGCVLIIHGKGGHSASPPVIKNLVYRWLPQWDEVLAFHSAQSKDGGYGALYVLLKKNKA